MLGISFFSGAGLATGLSSLASIAFSLLFCSCKVLFWSSIFLSKESNWLSKSLNWLSKAPNCVSIPDKSTGSADSVVDNPSWLHADNVINITIGTNNFFIFHLFQKEIISQPY